MKENREWEGMRFLAAENIGKIFLNCDSIIHKEEMKGNMIRRERGYLRNTDKQRMRSHITNPFLRGRG